MQRFLIKLDRISAWILLGGMLLYFITGYGMTKGIIDPAFAAKLHLSYLTYVVAIVFIVHTSYAIHLAFKRWRMWNGFTATLLFLVYLFLISSLVYVDKYYGKTDDEKSTAQNVETSTMSTTPTTTNSTPTQSSQSVTPIAKTFTVSELAKYNGQNGNSAYVAVDGQVYDLTSIFQNGKHFSHYAGTELTNAFYSYHAKIVLAKYPIVGTLVK